MAKLNDGEAATAGRVRKEANVVNHPKFGDWIDVTVRRLELLSEPREGRTAILTILKPIQGNEKFLLYPWQLEQLTKFAAPGCEAETAIAVINSDRIRNGARERAMVTLRTAYAEADVTTYHDKDDDKEYYHSTNHWSVEFDSCVAVEGAYDRVKSAARLFNLGKIED